MGELFTVGGFNSNEGMRNQWRIWMFPWGFVFLLQFSHPAKCSVSVFGLSTYTRIYKPLKWLLKAEQCPSSCRSGEISHLIIFCKKSLHFLSLSKWIIIIKKKKSYKKIFKSKALQTSLNYFTFWWWTNVLIRVTKQLNENM